MRGKMKLAGLGLGSLAFVGMVAAGPLAASAQPGVSSPTLQVAAQTSGDDEQASGPAVVGTPLLEPAIDLAQAQEIALKGQTGAVVTEVSLDGEDGMLAYSIELDNGVEVDVDATSGEVLKTEQAENGDDERDGEGENEDEDGTEEEADSEQG